MKQDVEWRRHLDFASRGREIENGSVRSIRLRISLCRNSKSAFTLRQRKRTVINKLEKLIRESPLPFAAAYACFVSGGVLFALAQ